MPTPELTAADHAEIQRQIELALRRAPDPSGDRLLELFDRLELAVEMVAAAAGFAPGRESHTA